MKLKTKLHSSSCQRVGARCRLAGLVRLEHSVDGAVVRRRVEEVGAALPAGLGQDSMEEAGGAVGRRWRGLIVSRRPPRAVPPQQLWSAATAAVRQSINQ